MWEMSLVVLCVACSPIWSETVSRATSKAQNVEKSICSSTDDPSDCAGLTAFGMSLRSDKWIKNTKWLSDKTVCEWHGITCDGGRVTEISLEHNGLSGALPQAIGNLTHLRVLNLNGGRPASYMGCDGNNFHNSSIPDSLYSLTSLESVNFEYTCLSGELSDQIGRLTQMVNFSIHGNYLSGSIPLVIVQCLNSLSKPDLTSTLPTVRP